MNTKQFKEKYHNQFMVEGFMEVDPNKDPLTMYEKRLISEEVIGDNDLSDDEIPTLFFGTNGVNTGFGIFTGACVVWLNSENPTEAVWFANQITEFEPIL